MLAEHLLDEQVRLLRLPRGPDRFQRYLATMTQGTHDMALPLATMNPMAGPDVLDRLRAWKDAGAERVLDEALDHAGPVIARHGLDCDLRVALVMSDDAGGGWTDRADHDMRIRFQQKALIDRDWAVVPLWSSEDVDLDELADRVADQAVRAALFRRDGAPHDLEEHVTLESRVGHLLDRAPAESLDGHVTAFRQHRRTGAYPVIFAFMQGDDAATRFGYDALGCGGGTGPREAMAIIDGAGRIA